MRLGRLAGAAALGLIAVAILLAILLPRDHDHRERSRPPATRADFHGVSMKLSDYWKAGFKVNAVPAPESKKLSPALRPAPTSNLGKLASADNTHPRLFGASTYQWERCDSAGDNCAAIAEAVSASYTLTAADKGHALRVIVDGVESRPYGITSTADNGSALPQRMPESSGTSEIFVSPSGSDSNPGTISSPVETLQGAFSKASSGSIIEVRGNAGPLTASTQSVTTNCSFSPSNPVTVRTYPGDAEAILASTGTSSNVYFGNCSGIRIRHVIFRSPSSIFGIKIDSCVHFELDDILSGPNGSSSGSGADGISISSSGTGVGTSRITSDLQIWNSRIYDWSHDPNNANNDHGIYSAVMKNGVIANDELWNTVNGGGYGIQLGGETDNSIVTNVTVDGVTSSLSGGNYGSGMVIWGSRTEKTQTPTYNDLVVNSLFTHNQAYGIAGHGSTSGSPRSTVRTDMFYANGIGNYRTLDMFDVGPSIYNQDPLYLNRTGHDFHLQEIAGDYPTGSPALGKAEPAYAPPLDKDGNLRPLGPALGAYN